MGSLTSRPDIPQVQTPLVISVPGVSVSETSAVESSAEGAPTAEQTAETAQAKAREASLLSRTRGAFSTVLTGFTGLLNDSAAAPAARKTLLGE